MPTIEVLGVEHVDLTVNNLERSLLFYDLVLGALGFRRLPTSEYAVWGIAQMSIGIRPAAASEQGALFNRSRVGLHHLALKAKRRDDVDRFYGFLQREGITVLDPPAAYPQYGPQYYAVFFADPDGMKLELAHFAWGYWRKVQTEGYDMRPRYAADRA